MAKILLRKTSASVPQTQGQLYIKNARCAKTSRPKNAGKHFHNLAAITVIIPTMRKKLAILGAALMLLLLVGLPAKAFAAAPTPTPTITPTASPSPTPAPDVVLCEPGVFPQNYAADCTVAGAAAYLSRMAALGYFYPPDPPPVTPLPKSWFAIPGKWRYARVLKDGERSVYGSLDDAIHNKHPNHLPKGFVFVSYEAVVYRNHKLYYRIDEAGRWMRRNDLAVVTPSQFRGVLVKGTPSHPFGWMVASVPTKRTPGLRWKDYTHHKMHRYEIIQVYDQKKANGTTWYMIAPDEWVAQRFVGLVFPRKKPPPGVTGGRWIEVNLFEQTLAVYDNYKLVFATLVSTGHAPFWTHPGLFRIYKKLKTTLMRGAFEADRSDYYSLEDVPWTMYYDDTRALHGAYWHDFFGYPTSHGCVNLSIADAHWLYEWSKVGDWVYVYDPSGKTPTDAEGGGP